MGEYTELKDKINELKEMPLFYLFLSSQELFHTNFWEWLFKVDKKKATNIFIDIDEESNIVFKREKYFVNKDKKANIDLAIMRKQDAICIIENKTKDFPTEEQLERIKNAVNKNCEYILVTLIKMDETNIEGWKQINYSDIAERIEKVNFKSNNIFDEMLIKEYVEFIRKLSEVADKLPNESKKYDFTKEHNKALYEILESVKLDILYTKWKSARFRNYILKEVRTDNLLGGYIDKIMPQIIIENSINNKKATITAKVEIEENFVVGVQIEGIQYRRFIVLNKGKNKENYNKFRNENFWFKEGYKSPKGKEILQYNLKDKVFYYEYEKIKNNEIEVEILKNKILIDLRYIINNIQSFKLKYNEI